jgi:hypothetical protein
MTGIGSPKKPIVCKECGSKNFEAQWRPRWDADSTHGIDLICTNCGLLASYTPLEEGHLAVNYFKKGEYT